MADNDKPIVRVIGFHQTYEKHPVRGTDPLNDTVDAQGFLVDKNGKRIMKVQEEDWVTYAPGHNPMTTHTTERVRHVIPDPERMGNDPEGVKLAFMSARWAQIEPAYDAWKKGKELPISGTALSMWPALNPEQVKVFRSLGIATVEEVRELSESQIGRIPLPNMRELKRQAHLFLENLNASGAAEREAEKDRTIEAMQDRLAQLEAMLAQQPAPQPAPPVVNADDVDGDIAALRAALDAKGIAYDGRWAAPKLRALLQPNGEPEAA